MVFLVATTILVSDLDLPTGELRKTYEGYDLENARVHVRNPIEQLKTLLKEI